MTAHNHQELCTLKWCERGSAFSFLRGQGKGNSYSRQFTLKMNKIPTFQKLKL